MKKFFLTIIIAASGLATQTANAQIGISIQIGPRVVQRPVVYDDFYYLPEVEAYYSVPEHCYYYMDGRSWVSAAYLPGRYHDYDWRSARRYQVRTQRPFDNHDYYRNRFGGNAGRDWNRNWDNNQYANRGYDRRDNNRNDDRRFDSPYDSNNAGRGGYNQPNHGNYDRINNWNRGNDNRNNNNWNNNRNEDRNRQNDNRGYGPDRNQGGYLNNNSNNPNNNRGNDRNNNRGNDNRGQRLVENGARDSRPDFGSVKRVAF
ncbi:hypothetical protein [Mucilaginibacter terrae]|nr:hypothetical protein [Mucilaginibacter terrae]